MFDRLFEPRLRRIKHSAAELLAGLDDRSRLLALELGTESSWLARLAGTALAAIIVLIICIVWLMATLVALSWDTPWRLHALGLAAAFWVLLSLVLILRIRHLIKGHPTPFPLSRKVLADDLRGLKSDLERDQHRAS
ncbi:MAG: phage holin family protein [Lautropia sp.]|nr:phage holin family protein [Lautropia sp.]